MNKCGVLGYGWGVKWRYILGMLFLVRVIHTGDYEIVDWGTTLPNSNWSNK